MKQENINQNVYTVPAADIYEYNEGFTLELEVPGVAKDDLELMIENDTLTINGKMDVTAYSDATITHREYKTHDYKRSFKISDEIEKIGVDAKLEDGVLTVHLKKKEEAKPKQIEIKVH